MNNVTTKNDGTQSLLNHPTVSSEEWTMVRKELLRKEKELTRLRDQLNSD
jgi:predicted dithiol-disulfide oxidoreductase (DUF899 family)